MDNESSLTLAPEVFIQDGATRLAQFLQREKPAIDYQKMEKLTGDASTRQYFRLYALEQALEPSPAQTFIAAVYQEAFDAQENSFCSINQMLTAAQLPVPRIVAIAGNYGIVLQEDLGDVRLQDWLNTATADDSLKAYYQAIDLILAIQGVTERAIETNSIAAQLAFDKAKLMWELEFFYKHYFGSYRQEVLSTTQEVALLEELTQIAEQLASRPRVLCHRDFHSRNLMLHNEQQYIIDHQDARMGPYTYDLASLLRDPYVALEEDVIERLYNYFVDACPQSSPSWRTELKDEFELMTVQRIVKAIGTYAYQTAVVKNNVYVAYIPRALATVLAAAERLNRFPVLRTLFAEQLAILNNG